ncbi:hypothetical protein LCGC14_2750680 [marine sediment metagenome]|uniref:Uncharacterized protein n=1 Tax=marine sediment metagenome TaxID=412755 RepID=A0A0F9BTI3_9ZZZZ
MSVVDTVLDREIAEIFSDIRDELRTEFPRQAGEHMFACVDCGAEHRLHIVHLTHPCKPRCTVCGSMFLEPATVHGRTAMVYRNGAFNGR